MCASKFKARLSFGKIGEGLIANWFKRKGYIALPIYEKQIDEGKGPQLFTSNRNLIAPDLLMFNFDKDGEKVFWIEAKHKSAFTWHRITQRWTTGIDLKHYQDYLEVDKLTPWPVWLIFLHEKGIAKDSPDGCPTGLFGRELSYLNEHENHRHGNWGKGGMVYWAHETLLKLATLVEVKAEDNHGSL